MGMYSNSCGFPNIVIEIKFLDSNPVCVEVRGCISHCSAVRGRRQGPCSGVGLCDHVIAILPPVLSYYLTTQFSLYYYYVTILLLSDYYGVHFHCITTLLLNCFVLVC